MRIKLNEHYFDDKSLASYFKVGRSTIWSYVKAGRLEKPLRLSARTVRWSPEQVMKFEKSLVEGFE